MNSLSNNHLPQTEQPWVRESRFGRWFLRSNTWYRYVLTEAILDFKKLLAQHEHRSARILDAGCGEGLAFGLLDAHFKPDQISGIDIDGEQLQSAQHRIAALDCTVDLQNCNAAQLPYDDNSFDLIFSHQLLHHTSTQEQILTEFRRVLAPNGWLLVAESCQAFINTSLVRWFFRHPAGVQKDSDGYICMIRDQGFSVDDKDIQVSTPWWSLSDFGISRKLGLTSRSTPAEITEVLLLARQV